MVIRDTSPSRTVNMKWLGPLKPLPPTSAVTVVTSPSVVTSVTVRATSTPMNSLSLHPRMASAPGNSRPQSSTTPSSVKLCRKASVSCVVRRLEQAGDGFGGRVGHRGRIVRTFRARLASIGHVRRHRGRGPRRRRLDGTAPRAPRPEGPRRRPRVVSERHALHPPGPGARRRAAAALGDPRRRARRRNAAGVLGALRSRAGRPARALPGVRGRERGLQPAPHAARQAAGRRRA